MTLNYVRDKLCKDPTAREGSTQLTLCSCTRELLSEVCEAAGV